MIILRYSPDYLLSYDDDFVILYGKVSETNTESFVFYNSIAHKGVRLNAVEFNILEMLYKYEDADFILKKIAPRHRIALAKYLDKIKEEKLLVKEKEEDIEGERKNLIPSSFYLHLTDRCNLRCTYCYNKEQRKQNKELSIEEWKIIIDRILPYAEEVALTGGECFLYKGIGEIIDYIKSKKKTVSISCISNGMHDFDLLSKHIDFKSFSGILFSCDSVNEELNRKGFDPRIFRSSIEYIRTNYPDIAVTISATRSAHNEKNLNEITEFCHSTTCGNRFINLVPETITDIEDMPTPFSSLCNVHQLPENENLQALDAKNMRCGAGLTLCSIDSSGDVYPCQALHYKEFYMGNILTRELLCMNYIREQEWCLPNTDEIDGCKSCNIRYLCGGGCLAVSYLTNNRTFRRNRLICPHNRENALTKLYLLKNTPAKQV